MQRTVHSGTTRLQRRKAGGLVVVTGVVVGVTAGRTTASGGGQAALNDLKQVPVLKCGLHALLVVQLLVDSVLRLVRALLDSEVDAIPRWQGTEQAHAERET